MTTTTKHKHDWQYITDATRSGWIMYTHWCPICGTLRTNDKYGRFRYQHPSHKYPVPKISYRAKCRLKRTR